MTVTIKQTWKFIEQSMAESIKIYVNQVEPFGWTPWDNFLRGTEEYVREFATTATKRGYKVSVFHNGEMHGEHGNVLYLPHSAFEPTCDILLVVKEASILDMDLTKAKRVIYYTNDIYDRERLTPERLAKVEKVVAISNYHKETFLQSVPKVEVVYHGCDPARYRKVTPDGHPQWITPKKEYLCLYASSPDRGLDKLKEFWPEIKRAIPRAELMTAYDGTPEEVLDEMYRIADFWIYPCHGVELFCITGLKAQCAGAIPIVVPHMALAETVRYGAHTTMEEFVRDTIKCMKDREAVEQMRDFMLYDDEWQTHEDVVTQTLA